MQEQKQPFKGVQHNGTTYYIIDDDNTDSYFLTWSSNKLANIIGTENLPDDINNIIDWLQKLQTRITQLEQTINPSSPEPPESQEA